MGGGCNGARSEGVVGEGRSAPKVSRKISTITKGSKALWVGGGELSRPEFSSLISDWSPPTQISGGGGGGGEIGS